MKHSIFLIAVACCLTKSSKAQNESLGSWNILNLKYTYSSKLSFTGEAQLRSLKFYNNFHYYEYKAAVNYKFYKNATATIGAGSYQTYREGGNFKTPKNNNEFRLWPQLTTQQKLGKINVEHRYRAELRFTSNGYRNRFRYRLGLSNSFGKDTKGYKPYQLSLSNELFFTNNEPYFERNRVALNFGFKPTKSVTLQAGLLHQFDYRINDETGRSFLQIGCFLELIRKQTAKPNIETIAEPAVETN
jgi:Protein of unknown function (DUF2490)